MPNLNNHPPFISVKDNSGTSIYEFFALKMFLNILHCKMMNTKLTIFLRIFFFSVFLNTSFPASVLIKA